MALVLEKAILTVQLLGEKKSRRSGRFEIAIDPGAADDAAAMQTVRGEAAAIIAALAVITAAEILSYQVSGVFVEDTVFPVPADANPYEEVALSVGLDGVAFKRGALYLPSPRDGVFISDDDATGTVDTADTDLLDWVAQFAAPNRFALSDGEQILSDPAIRGARLRSVASGRNF